MTDKFKGMTQEEIEAWDKKEARKNKRTAYLKAEQEGKLPSSEMDNISKLWDAIDALSKGEELPNDIKKIISERSKINDR